jgi:hypothetical protein
MAAAPKTTPENGEPFREPSLLTVIREVDTKYPRRSAWDPSSIVSSSNAAKIVCELTHFSKSTKT